MKLPDSRNHKPVIISDNYGKLDGRFANNTDAKVLSLGLTPVSDEGKSHISANLWKYTEDKWSGQFEEIPIHRILDLSILLCSTLNHFSEAYRYEHLYDPQQPVIDRIGLQGNAMTVAVSTENDEINEDIKLFNKALSDDGEMIGERLRTLSRLLMEMGYD